MFKKGDDPNRNSAGRPKGSPDKRSITKNAIAKYNQDNPGKDALTDIMASLINAAKEGCVQSSKVILERLEPAYKSISAPINLGQLPKDLYKKGERIILMATRGEIPIETAKELLSSIASLMTVKEKTELETRLKALEDKAK